MYSIKKVLVIVRGEEAKKMPIGPKRPRKRPRKRSIEEMEIEDEEEILEISFT